MNLFWRLALIGIGGFCLMRGISLIRDLLALFPPPVDNDGSASATAPRLIDILVGTILILLGASCLAGGLVRLAASPFTAFIDSVFLPGEKGGKPALNLELPAFYERQNRFEEALTEYQKMIRFHPEQPIGWLGAIRLLLGTFEDQRQARRLYEKARRRFRSDQDTLASLEKTWREAGGESS